MDNLCFTGRQSINLELGQALRSSYEQATKTILVLDGQYRLHFLQYTPETRQVLLRKSTPTIQQLEGQNVLLLEYLVDAEAALALTQNGGIMTISESGLVDVKAQNDDGISGGSVSPAQEYVYVVTKNNTIIQLDMEFDLIKQVPLDDHETEKVDSYDPRFSWKADGSFFALNILTDKGRKCHTRDAMLGIFRSPSKSDVEPQGLVQSVSQKSRQNMTSSVAWQPSAGIIAGADFISQAGKKVNRVIFWQKNGLRHLEFHLPHVVTDVLNLTWSPDSQILAVEVLLINSQRWLYLYHRSNYQWHLKHSLRLLSQNTQYFLIKKKHNQILTIDPSVIKVYEYELTTTGMKWLTQSQQAQNPSTLQVCIDGPLLKITDFAKGIIPPPMCHFPAQFQSNLHGVSVWGQTILAVTEVALQISRWDGNQLKQRKSLKTSEQHKEMIEAPVNFKIIESLPKIRFKNDQTTYEIDQQSLCITKIEDNSSGRSYSLAFGQEGLQPMLINSQLNEGNLRINGLLYAQHCTSYMFYHEFLIFTVASSNMYDKMFVLDFALDELNAVKDVIKIRLEEMEAKKMLNYRAIQRGAKIVGCSKNRVIFELPRGNLQAIYPKVIAIKYVLKCLQRKQFKEAFETIRTHKLDLNLLYDIDPQTFTEKCEEILLNIKRTDYLNLFISQLKDTVSSELQYCKTQQQIQQIVGYLEVKVQEKKIKEVCEIVSKTLKKCDRQKYILSIFTAEIKMGLLNQVLFEIKDMRKNDVEVIVPPHLQENGTANKPKKALNSQQVLEYVCWLVDAGAIYEASLLTYDLQLASMTARCTQMDPKEYIPYLEELKTIEDPIELRRRICMDLKKYEQAVEELSRGNEQQIRASIDLIKKHKLFKCGLKSYSQKANELRQVKLIVIEELLSSGQNNEAYRMYLSIGQFGKALDIAKNLTDGNKIIQSLECQTEKTKDQRQEEVKQITLQIGEDGFKNKSDLALLKAYIGQYDEATSYYLRAGNYQQSFKTLIRCTQKYKQSQEYRNGMQLLHSLQKNQLLKQKQEFIQKSVRLHKVHKQRSVQGPTLNVRNLENDDMYSEVSVSSKAASEYTISTTTGMRKKRDKKRSILSRNVKEGSPLEEEYLIAFLVDLLSKVEPNIKQTKLLIQHLIYVNMIAEAESLRNVCRQYGEVASKCNPKFYAQVKFEADHPEYLELLEAYENRGILEKQKAKDKKQKFSIDSFNYMF